MYQDAAMQGKGKGKASGPAGQRLPWSFLPTELIGRKMMIRNWPGGVPHPGSGTTYGELTKPQIQQLLAGIALADAADTPDDEKFGYFPWSEGMQINQSFFDNRTSFLLINRAEEDARGVEELSQDHTHI